MKQCLAGYTRTSWTQAACAGKPGKVGVGGVGWGWGVGELLTCRTLMGAKVRHFRLPYTASMHGRDSGANTRPPAEGPTAIVSAVSQEDAYQGGKDA
jgi:hypothetical protein